MDILLAVLSRQQLSRRWSTLNTNGTFNHLPYREYDSWLDQVLQYLVDAHSPDVIEGLSFDVVESRYSVCRAFFFSHVSCSYKLQDLAIDLRGDSFKWRWETSFIGRSHSAELLSKHLIMPLLCTANLAFTMRHAINGISDYDLEQVGFESSLRGPGKQPRFTLARG